MTAARSVAAQIFLLWGVSLLKMSAGEWRFLCCFPSCLFILTWWFSGKWAWDSKFIRFVKDLFVEQLHVFYKYSVTIDPVDLVGRNI